MGKLFRVKPVLAVSSGTHWKPSDGRVIAMRAFLRRKLEPLTRDDLFVRVVSLLAGLVLGAIGVGMLAAGASQESRAWLGWFNLLWWPIAALLTVWGLLLMSRCAVPAGSGIARLAERWLPSPASIVPDEGTLLALIFVVPAALLTLLLRLVGIRGQTSPP